MPTTYTSNVPDHQIGSRLKPKATTISTAFGTLPTYLFAAFLFAISGAVAQGAEYHIAVGGNDTNNDGTKARPWETLSHAETRVRPGDTVFIHGGTYTNNQRPVIWRKSGTAAAPIIIRNFPGEQPIFEGGNGAHVFMYIRSADWLTIDGIHVRNYGTGTTGDSAAGCFWIGYSDEGKGTDPADNVTFQNIRAENCGSNAHAHVVYVSYGVRNLTIRNSYLAKAFGGCVHQYHAPGVQGFQLYNNVLARCHWGAILSNGARDVKIYNNTFYENAEGISVRHTGECSGPCGDADSGVFDTSVFNNIIYQTGSQSLNGLRIGSLNIERRSVTTDHNLFYVTAGTPILWITEPLSLAQYVARSGQGKHSVDKDPLFADRARLDFRLREGSPAINAGANLFSAGVTKDFAGVARPLTGPFEIGAYEYGGTAPPPPSFDFALANGGNKTVTRGGSVTNSLTASLVSGTAQAVSLSFSGLPSGVTGRFSPTSCTPNCSSTLTLSASTAAALGTASVTVTAAGGGMTRTSAFTLTVNAVQTSTHSLTLSAAQAAPGAAFTATVNGGSGSATQWVGVYLATAPDSAYSYKSNWKYLNGTQTAPAAAVPTPVQLTFAAPTDVGVYNLRFFANTGAGTRLALSPNLTVTKAGNGTDLNGDGITNVADVQIAVNQASGASACGSGDVNKDGVCNVSDIQLVVNKALGL
mgnify:FL=1